MQITFDPHNKAEANEVLELLQGETWPVPEPVVNAKPESKKPAAKKAEPVKETKTVTKDDLVKAMKPLLTDKKHRAEIKDLFTEFGAESLGGVAETDYAELLEKVKGLSDDAK